MRLPDLVAYQAAIQHPATAFADPELRAAIVTRGRLGLPRAVAGNFAVTYQLCHGSQQWAVRCFHREAADRASRYAAISISLAGLRDGPLVPIKYIETGVRVGSTWYPITKMPWIDGRPLNRAVEANLSAPAALLDLEKRFTRLVAELRRRGVAHGDLQHGNILVHQSGTVRLVDYDGMFVPALHGRPASESGDPNYQHPRRTAQFDAELDRFAALVIVIALRAVAAAPGLWERYNTGDNLLFRRLDFADPRNSPLFQDLSTLPPVRTLSERFADVCQDDYTRVPLLDDFLNERPVVPVVFKPGHVVVLNRLYGTRRRSNASPYSWKLRRAVVQQAVAFSPDGALVATGGADGRITVRQATTGRTQRGVRFARLDGPIRGLAVSPGGGIVAAIASGRDVSVADVTAARRVQLLESGGRTVRAVALSPGGTWVASGTHDGKLRCWKVADGRLVAAFSAPGRISAIAVSADGRRLATAGAGGQVNLWKVPGGRFTGRVVVGKTVACLAFSFDSSCLAIGTIDGQLRLWNVATSSFERDIRVLACPLESVALSADGKCLAMTGRDGSMSMRRLPAPVKAVELRQPGGGVIASSHRLLDWIRRVALL